MKKTWFHPWSVNPPWDADPPIDPRITIRGPERWSVLSTYNAECSRGILHTAEWDELMAEEQRKYDEFRKASGSR